MQVFYYLFWVGDASWESASSWLLILHEKPRCFDAGDGAGACGHDALAVVGVLYIAGGKDTRNVGTASARLGDDIALGIHLELALEEVALRGHPNCLEDAIDFEDTFFARLHIADLKACHLLDKALLQSEDIHGHMVPYDLDVRGVQNQFLQGGSAAELAAAVHNIDLGAELRQIERVFQRRVAAADDDGGAFAEEVAVAGGAGRNAEAAELLFGGESEPAGLGAGSHDDGIGSDFIFVVHPTTEGAGGEIDLGDDTGAHLGANMEGLVADILHDDGAGRAFWIAGKILDFIGDSQLATHLKTLNEEGVEVCAGGVYTGGISGRSGAYNQAFNMFSHSDRIRRQR